MSPPPPPNIFPSLLSSTDLVILDLPSHDPEGVVARVVVDVDPAEARGPAGRDPLLVGIVVDHHSSSCLADTLFTAGRKHRTSVRYLQPDDLLDGHTGLHQRYILVTLLMSRPHSFRDRDGSSHFTVSEIKTL